MIKEEKKFAPSDVMEGMSSISALIKGMESTRNNRKIIKVLIDQDRAKQKKAEIRFLKAKSSLLGFVVDFVSAEEIDALTVGNTHGGIVAKCTPRQLPMLTDDLIEEKGLYFILEGIEDPYNFGYAVRSLYAAGATGIIVGERNWMGASGVVARSSAGCSELMNMYVCDPLEAVVLLSKKGYRILCAGIRDSVSLFDTDLSLPLCVVLGGEKRGISRAVLDKADQIVRIDYGADFGGSLSTAASAAVFGFEIFRYNR